MPRASLGHGDLIPFDMGGTSTDISLIVGGEAAIASDRRLAGQRVALQSLDIASIGAGGGSIARVDAGGVLHVGPESAGAEPGPACYGRGGTRADRHRRQPRARLSRSGQLPRRAHARLDRAAAEAAVDRIAGKLGVDRMAAAEGIHRVINTRMAEGIRLVSVRRGVDPRRFALLSFGGAAGLHVTDVARQLDLRRVIVPRLAAVLSAWGMLRLRPALRDRAHAHRRCQPLDAGALRAAFREMEAEGRARLAAAAHGAGARAALRRHALRRADLRDQRAARRHRLRRRRSRCSRWRMRSTPATRSSTPTRCRDQEVVLVNARVAVIGELPAAAGAEPGDAAAGGRCGQRQHLPRRLARRAGL